MDPNTTQPTLNPTPTSNTPLSTIPLQNPSPSQIPPSSPSPEPPKKFNFLKFTLLEIIFVVFLLATILTTLQFFHVINFVSFFTHPKQITTTVSATPTLPPTQPTLFPLSTIVFAPLSTYITQTLRPEFVPSDGLSTLIAQQLGNMLQAHWTKNNASIIFVATYQSTTSSPLAMLSLNISNASTAATFTSPMSTSSAQLVVSTYFLPFTTTTSWQCSTTQNNSQCELSEKSSSGIIGYRVTLNPTIQQTPTSVIASECMIPASSFLYSQQNRCFLQSINSQK